MRKRKRPENCVKITIRADGRQVYWVPCTMAGCSNLADALANKKSYTGRCRPCSGALGFLFGVAVRSARIWALRKQIVGIDERQSNGHRGGWLIRCSTPGCEHTLRLTSHLQKGSTACRFCVGVTRRKRPFERAYNTFKRQKGKKRGHEVTLTYDQFAALLRVGVCHYCQRDISRQEFYRWNSAERGTSAYIDRKDSGVGYTPENSVPCCPACNYVKGPYLSEGEMLVIAHLRAGRAMEALETIAQGFRKGTAPDERGFIKFRLSQ